MSDEEKKAIEWLKKADWFSARLYSPTILNLIEKQSKEIEELNKENTRQHELIGNIHKKWKDKIKAEIKELQNMKVDGEVFTTAVNFAIKEMQLLLEKE